MKTNVRWYGWQRDVTDRRDYMFRAPVVAPLPASAQVPAVLLPPVRNQGALGSCTAHGILGCAWVAAMKQAMTREWNAKLSTEQAENLSHLMLYWGERTDKKVDSGAQIRVGIKIQTKYGSSREVLWPYVIAKFREKPPAACWDDALLHQALKYERIQDANLQAMKACLAGGHPFTFGFTVYRQFESKECAKSGLVRLPGRKESILGAVGGHCVYAIGYDDAKAMPDGKGAIRCRNSWGNDWGLDGDFWMPYPYLTSSILSGDFWRIDVMEV